MVVKGIIFDCDGVLVDSEPLSIRALLTLAKPYHCTITVEEGISIFHGKSYRDCIDLMEKNIGSSLPSTYEEEFRKLSFSYFQKELTAVRGVKEFINRLIVPFCVASSGPVDKIRLNLSLVNLLDQFEGKIFSSYEINSWKPDPGIFLYAAAQMGFEIHETIVIEDSVPGVTAAVKGGFKVFAYANEHTAGELRNAGATLFYYFSDLPELIANYLHWN